VVFDKTGTLTEGKPQVTDILTADDIQHGSSQRLKPLLVVQSPPTRTKSDIGLSELDDNTISQTELLQLAAAAESVTNHPLAVAIQQEATRLGLTIPVVLNSQTAAGLGVYAEVQMTGDNLDGRYQVIVGNQNCLTAKGIEVSEEWLIAAEQLTVAGKTVMYVAILEELPLASNIMGIIGVTDRLRVDAIETVKQLQQKGLRVVLLTGDRAPVAKLIAAKLGILDIYAEILPQDKARIIQSLQTPHISSGIPHKVAMIGDGINDAPALAQADVGIAMNAGTDVAIEVADIILMCDRLLDVVYSIELSTKTFIKIRQNLFWAAIYNLLGIPAAAGLLYWVGWGAMLSPSAAGGMMALSSVSVVTNSLLLRLGKPSIKTIN
jgi:P-type Cu2+ transporter